MPNVSKDRRCEIPGCYGQGYGNPPWCIPHQQRYKRYGEFLETIPLGDQVEHELSARVLIAHRTGAWDAKNKGELRSVSHTSKREIMAYYEGFTNGR